MDADAVFDVLWAAYTGNPKPALSVPLKRIKSPPTQKPLRRFFRSCRFVLNGKICPHGDKCRYEHGFVK